MTDRSDMRARMVDTRIAARGIRDSHVLAAMRKVPRDAFVDPGHEEFAYEDGPLPIGQDQSISQPYIVALMIGAAGLRPGDRALEIGTGSGYAAAVMAEIADTVQTVERRAGLAATAREKLAAAGYGRVSVHVGDGTLGWDEAVPYDAILVAS